MNRPPALLVKKDTVKMDSALQAGKRGARKLLVTELYIAKEQEATDVKWQPADGSAKCPVQIMADTEVAVFNHFAHQDRHYHKKGTEIYMVLEGEMIIEVEGQDYSLLQGDMIVANPNAVHEVKPEGTEFLCRVITTNCGGTSDKFQDKTGGEQQ